MATDPEAVKSILEQLERPAGTRFSEVTLEWFEGQASEKAKVVVGVSKRVQTGDPEDFAAAVETIRNKFYDAISFPPDKQHALQAQKLTEIIATYDHFVAEGHVFSRDTVVAMRDFRRINYKLQSLVLHEKGAVEASVALLTTAINEFPETGMFYGFRARYLNQLKRFEEALPDIERAIETEPDTSLWFDTMGRILINLEHLNGALTAYNRAIEIAPKDAEFLCGRARCFRIRGEFKESIKDYDAALAINPQNTWALDGRSYSLIKTKQFDRSLADRLALVEIDRKSAKYHALVGEAYKILEDYPRAIEEYDRSIELGGLTAVTYRQRGESHHELKDYDKALHDYNRALEIDPDDTFAICNRAGVWFSKGNYRNSIADCNAALAVDSADTHSLNVRANAYRALGQPEKATEDWTAITRLQPDSIPHWQALVYDLTQSRKFSKALDAIEEVTIRGGNTEWTFNQNAWLRHNLGEYKQAISDADSGILHHPKYHYVWNTRSFLHAQQGNLKLALSDIEEAMKLAPDDAANHWVRGYIRREQRDYSKAIQDFDRAIEIDPTFKEAIAVRALILASYPDESIRDVEQARSEVVRSIGLTAQWSPAISLDALAAVYAAEGDFESAVKNVTKALEVASGVDDLDDMRVRLKLYKARKPFVLPAADSETSKQGDSTEVSDD